MLVLGLGVINLYAGSRLSEFKGVWASDDAEAVITDSVCIYFAKVDSTIHATLEIPSLNYYHETTFEKGGTVTSKTLSTSMEILKKGDEIEIKGSSLKKVEHIEIVAPYEMMECMDTTDIGRCLQEWRLGVSYVVRDNMPHCEINTNRHMFIYMVNPSMVYIRAAATRNCDAGTLFSQNIRMMKNQNTGEFTLALESDNYTKANEDLNIEPTKFNPKACTFSPDGGIYWSVISYTPTEILLNGCGETYTIYRPEPTWPLNEWIKFQPYSAKTLMK